MLADSRPITADGSSSFRRRNAIVLRAFSVDSSIFEKYARTVTGKGRTVAELRAELDARFGAKFHANLQATLQAQLLPRLVMAHGAPSMALTMSSDSRTPPTADEVASLAHFAANDDLLGALQLICSLVSHGMSQASVLLLLVAPAAQFLSEQWSSEQRTFAEVMNGLEVIRQVAESLQRRAPSTET